MKKTVEVTIAGQEYRLVSEEDEAYVQRIAQLVDEKYREIASISKLSQVDTAVLAATRIAEDYLKAAEGAENLRAQLKDFLEEATRAKSEAAELRRELNRLKSKHSTASANG